MPYATAVRRVVWRTWSRFVTRAELRNGNRERLRDTFGRNSIVWYVLTKHRRFAEQWPGRLGAHPHLEVVRLRSQRSVDEWLHSIEASEPLSGRRDDDRRYRHEG
jgi:hypothetical protein